MKTMSVHKYRLVTAAFCLLTMLSATVVVSGNHVLAESNTEIVEFEEFEEAVPVRRIKHRRCGRITFVGHRNFAPSQASSELNFIARTERDNLNGIGGFLTT